MVIQRIQSLLLLMAALVVVALCFIVPIGMGETQGVQQLVYMHHSPSLLILGLLVLCLLVIDIFLFKNLALQIRVAGLCVLLLVALCGDSAFVMCARLPEGFQALWIGPLLVWIAAVILTLYARNRMKADQNLLKSYDRIR